MLDCTIEVEHWLNDRIRDFERLTAVFDIPLNRGISIHYKKLAKTLKTALEKYRDQNFIALLDQELKSVYQNTSKAKRANGYVGHVLSLFGSFWEAAQKYESSYTHNNISDKKLEELLYEVRSFVKHETWDADPYNFDQTIESVLLEYYKSEEDIEIRRTDLKPELTAQRNNALETGEGNLQTPMVKIQTQRLESITSESLDMLIYAKYELRNRWNGSLESPFMQGRYRALEKTENYNGELILVLDPNSFESELKNNFLEVNEIQRNNYFKLITVHKRALVDEVEVVKNLLDELKKDIKEGTVNSFELIDDSIRAHSNISGFVTSVEWLLQDTDRILRIIDKYLDLFCSDLEKTGSQSENYSSPQNLINGEKVGIEPKLKWNCSPAIAGYIISELIRAGFIEPPKTHGELSYAKLANICNQLFDIRSDGKPTTLDYLKKVVNPESNPLPDYKRAKLNLPDLDQLI